ncbi:uncharacterized protein BO80DRAFT_437622 [Aspergillus ibericus CBS 121593]|uniref:Uncharacterized protein n=1 Tax=Aspergillus ibericus CBS 121593 TaxID=1448316 RepID=A0A395GPX2_9EURO|nr:hypothetical protein BO80DRAFT_437622 [Aspergillus ibericus CBS 121593]RAK97560.1 hypothetical protein BO80DRAFT_437622 [Aspergillus ibericus CBS 121593]
MDPVITDLVSGDALRFIKIYQDLGLIHAQAAEFNRHVYNHCSRSTEGSWDWLSGTGPLGLSISGFTWGAHWSRTWLGIGWKKPGSDGKKYEALPDTVSSTARLRGFVEMLIQYSLCDIAARRGNMNEAHQFLRDAKARFARIGREHWWTCLGTAQLDLYTQSLCQHDLISGIAS